MLIRNTLSNRLNLANFGMGNEIAFILSESIMNMPYLQSLNIADNNLGDEGLSCLITAISHHRDIRLLNISQNAIGTRAAGALASFLGNAECQLQILKMVNSDIDDAECAKFVEVLMRNRELKELDLSENLIGKDETLNFAKPDFTTGGEALAMLLASNTCPIQKLILTWNMLRKEGADKFCDSIRHNRTLLQLDVSYNALGRGAACILGCALLSNNTLENLNLAYNGIDAVGCFTIVIGARRCKSLRHICLDGNPIGDEGGKTITRAIATLGGQINITSKNVDFSQVANDTKLRQTNPYRPYQLDLSLPYDRAVAIELVDMFSTDQSIRFSQFDFIPEGETKAKPMKFFRNIIPKV